MSKRPIFIATMVAILLAAGLWWAGSFKHDKQAALSRLPDHCDEVSFENSRYIVCSVDPASAHVSLHLKDSEGRPWRSLQRFADHQRGQGRPITFAMNAGMYHDDMSPVGLFIENGKEHSPLNTGSGEGNFFLKPNGVFGMSKDGKPFILDTVAYLNAALDVETATQSGPVLVIDGQIHPRFEPDGKSRFIRNGVGITEGRKLIFALSRDPVSFGAFARLFKLKFACPNALYFDGVVSAFSNGDSTIEGGGYPAGPIVSVTMR